MTGRLTPSRTPRTNFFAVYNSVENDLMEPFCNRPTRPEYVADREIEAIN